MNPQPQQGCPNHRFKPALHFIFLSHGRAEVWSNQQTCCYTRAMPKRKKLSLESQQTQGESKFRNISVTLPKWLGDNHRRPLQRGAGPDLDPPLKSLNSGWEGYSSALCREHLNLTNVNIKSNSLPEPLPHGLHPAETREMITFPICNQDQGHPLTWMIPQSAYILPLMLHLCGDSLLWNSAIFVSHHSDLGNIWI